MDNNIHYYFKEKCIRILLIIYSIFNYLSIELRSEESSLHKQIIHNYMF